MFANVGSDLFSVLDRRMLKDPLNEIIAVLVAGDWQMSALPSREKANRLTIDQRYTWAIGPTLTDPVQVSVQELVFSNFEALFNNL